MKRKRVIIIGAAGRDFHNFNTVYRDNADYEVVAFTATQIPDIADRRYPAILAGKLYPKGIPIYDEKELPLLIDNYDVDEAVFSYSDVSFDHVMSVGAIVNSCGCDFRLLGTQQTMLRSKKPVVAICAVRTGSGKSQTTRKVSNILKRLGLEVVVVRHPMPYGDLGRQVCQRFAKYQDLVKHRCTIEEREEYEPHLNNGTVVYAGVDYQKILREAEKEADIIVWDGGNNDLPFFEPDVHITVVDPHRPGHETSYYPGKTNLILADIVVINKIDTAALEGIKAVRESVAYYNPTAEVVEAASPIFVDNPEIISGKKVLVVEDGPTLTHGEMTYGAGVVAAQKFGAAGLVDPRPYTVASITETYKSYPHIGTLLPAMGYGPSQIKDLEKTINRAKADSVVIATPIDLRKLININKPSTRVRYELQEIGQPDLETILRRILSRDTVARSNSKSAQKKKRRK